MIDFGEDYSSNLEALGRFKPGSVIGAADTGELEVILTTNLAGQPIRFSFNESLDNIVSFGTLTMLNAIIGDEGEQQVGVMGEVKTEEDMAKWGTVYDSAPVEPNQLVWVTESGGGLGTCTTYWRVVGVTSYLDENDVPYYDVQLEGMGQIAIDTKFDPTLLGAPGNEILFFDRSYWDKVRETYQIDADNDGYITEEEYVYTFPGELSTYFNGERFIVESPSRFLEPFFSQIAAKGLDCGSGVIPEITWMPCYRVVNRGESCWQIIEDVLGFSGIIARFTRNKRLVYIDTVIGESGSAVWVPVAANVGENGMRIYNDSDYDEDGNFISPLQSTDITNFSSGLQLSYSKEGVYSQAVVSGIVSEKDEDGNWVPQNAREEEKVTVVSPAALNILNGEIVEVAVQADENYLLPDIAALENYGKKELYKSVLGARSATYDSETVPLNVECGMTIMGSSKLGGTTVIFITALSRTTDSQQGKITTNLSGTSVPTSVLKPWPDWPDTDIDIAWLVKVSGILLGYPDGKFNPNESITMHQAILVAQRLGLPAPEDREEYWSTPASREWITDNWPQYSYIEGREDEPVTRYQFALAASEYLKDII